MVSPTPGRRHLRGVLSRTWMVWRGKRPNRLGARGRVAARNGSESQSATEPGDARQGATVDRSSILRASTKNNRPPQGGLYFWRRRGESNTRQGVELQLRHPFHRSPPFPGPRAAAPPEALVWAIAADFRARCPEIRHQVKDGRDHVNSAGPGGREFRPGASRSAKPGRNPAAGPPGALAAPLVARRAQRERFR